MKNPARVSSLISCSFLVFLFAACEVWGPRNNPRDRDAENYQGFETIDSPNAAKPADPDAGVVAFVPVLACSRVRGAEAYRFQIAATADFANPLYTSAESASNEFIPTDCPGLSASTTYYWRVGVKKDAAWSDYSTSLARFRLSAPMTGAIAPVDSSTTFDATPLLDWGDVIGASTYELQIADTSDAVAGSSAIGATASQHQVAAILAIGDIRHWRVRAMSEDGRRGAWSSIWSFTASRDYNLTPTPASGGTTSDTTPLLDWEDVTGAIGYELQIGSSPTAMESSTAVALTNSEHAYPGTLAPGDTVYWRVRAENENEAWGIWPGSWSFTVTLIDMVLVPAGTFSMGLSILADEDPVEYNELPVHTVTLSAFRLSEYEVTQSQYESVTGVNPSRFSSGSDAANCPVERVTWFDTVEFCNKLSVLERLQPVYDIANKSPSSGYPIRSATVGADFAKTGYRLPTEAQWEYAARGGTSATTFHWGNADDDATVGQYAWFRVNSDLKTHAVGQKQANDYGLHDMVGNVAEWCWDFEGSYPSGAQADPTGPILGWGRILRGGAWLNIQSELRPAHREGMGADDFRDDLGFRIAAPARQED